MAQNFIACDREQELLLPPSLRDWLPESHLAWFVIDAVAQLELSGFYAAYRADGHGRAAHDPAMMVHYEQIAREILAEADAVDAEEDERFGHERGDELPPELSTAQGRRGWLREPSDAWTSGAPRRPVDRARPARSAARGQAPPGGRARGRVPRQRRLLSSRRPTSFSRTPATGTRRRWNSWSATA